VSAPLRGSLVALPTPFCDEEPDLDTLGRLIELHVESGTDGLVAIGTSGEAATLTDFERRTVIDFVLERCAGRLPVVVGTGTNATRTSIEHTRAAAEAGADAVLVVTPYYNKPGPAGLIAHFGAVAEASAVPVVLYNVPARTGCDLLPETATEIGRRCPGVVAIKEAGGSLERGRELIETSGLAVLSGEDHLIAPLMALGAVGAIGVVANIAPRQVAELCRVSAPDGDPARREELESWLAPLIRACFVESNPVPMKAALSAMGYGTGEVRLPLAPLEASSAGTVRVALDEAGLLSARIGPTAGE
jgi:4-hydroxy-tetrahydrodipicolinate synthase